MDLNFVKDKIYIVSKHMSTCSTTLDLHKTTGNDCLLTGTSVLSRDKLLLQVLIPFGQHLTHVHESNIKMRQ